MLAQGQGRYAEGSQLHLFRLDQTLPGALMVKTKSRFYPIVRYVCPRHGGSWTSRPGSGLGLWMTIRSLIRSPLVETCERCNIRVHASRLEWGHRMGNTPTGVI